MFCPKCGHIQRCGIKCCKHKKGWKRVKGNLQACGNCGMARPVEWWFELEWDITEESRAEQRIGIFKKFRFKKLVTIKHTATDQNKPGERK